MTRTPFNPPENPELPARDKRPALLAPMPLLILIGFILGLHAYRTYGMGLFSLADIRFLGWTAYVPARFSIWVGFETMASVLQDIRATEGGISGLRLALFQVFIAPQDSALWTLVTYAFLHGGWEHAIVNCLWMLAFGSPVMRRFGTLRFLMFFCVTAALSALFHTVFNANDVAVLVGASGSVSALTAAALRFAIGPGGFGGGQETWHLPARPLSVALRDKQVMLFIAVWFCINLLSGIGVPLGGGDTVRIAWEAHVGGFLAGLLLFSWFDPVSAKQEAKA